MSCMMTILAEVRLMPRPPSQREGSGIYKSGSIHVCNIIFHIPMTHGLTQINECVFPTISVGGSPMSQAMM